MERNPRTKILLVDDKESNLLALQSVLESPRFLLMKAHSGMEAIRLAIKNDFAAILLDLSMPGMDGYETARRIRSIPGLEDIPIIFITALYKEDEDIRRGYAAGAVDYFGKPFDPNLLRSKVRIYADLKVNAMKLHEMERELAAAKKKHLKTEGELEAVLGAIPTGLIITDAKGKVVRVNDEARRLWFGAKTVPADWNWADPAWWAGSEDSRRQQSAMAGALERGEACGQEAAEIRCLDGTTKTILSSISPLREESGAVSGAAWAILDVASVNRFAHIH